MSPLVQIKIGNQVGQTKKHKSANKQPSWEESFDFNYTGKEAVIEFIIYDSKIKSSKKIGNVLLSIDVVLKNPQISHWLDLSHKQKAVGTLLIQIRNNTASNKMLGIQDQGLQMPLNWDQPEMNQQYEQGMYPAIQPNNYINQVGADQDEQLAMAIQQSLEENKQDQGQKYQGFRQFLPPEQADARRDEILKQSNPEYTAAIFVPQKKEEDDPEAAQIAAALEQINRLEVQQEEQKKQQEQQRHLQQLQQHQQQQIIFQPNQNQMEQQLEGKQQQQMYPGQLYPQHAHHLQQPQQAQLYPQLPQVYPPPQQYQQQLYPQQVNSQQLYNQQPAYPPLPPYQQQQALPGYPPYIQNSEENYEAKKLAPYKLQKKNKQLLPSLPQIQMTEVKVAHNNFQDDDDNEDQLDLMELDQIPRLQPIAYKGMDQGANQKKNRPQLLQLQ